MMMIPMMLLAPPMNGAANARPRMRPIATRTEPALDFSFSWGAFLSVPAVPMATAAASSLAASEGFTIDADSLLASAIPLRTSGTLAPVIDT